MSEELSAKTYCSCCDQCVEDDEMNENDVEVICPECGERCHCLGCFEDVKYAEGTDEN